MDVIMGGHPYKKIEVLTDPNIQVACPVCEAGRGVRCESAPGVARFDSHIQRKERGEERRLQKMAENHALSLLGAQAHDVMRRTP